MKLKGVIAIVFVVVSLNICSCSRPESDSEMVYVCVSATAPAYHTNKYCQGLQRCTHEIKRVTKKEAKEKYGRRPCEICANQAVLDVK